MGLPNREIVDVFAAVMSVTGNPVSPGSEAELLDILNDENEKFRFALWLMKGVEDLSLFE